MAARAVGEEEEEEEEEEEKDEEEDEDKKSEERGSAEGTETMAKAAMAAGNS